MPIADLQPVAPAVPPDGSLIGWIVLAVLLALVVTGGLVLASRR